MRGTSTPMWLTLTSIIGVQIRTSTTRTTCIGDLKRNIQLVVPAQGLVCQKVHASGVPIRKTPRKNPCSVHEAVQLAFLAEVCTSIDGTSLHYLHA
mmetsp:Transcript_81133/g.160812  ORF Transcript_81133/g.160812 Transcript_81133/m.160812 type:complete len:96 (-) Transcript_81133:112-399(-)